MIAQRATPALMQTAASSDGPIVAIHSGPDHRPVGATAAMRIAAPPARIWAVVSDVSNYGANIPMIHRVRRDGDRVNVHLKFKVALFSVGFDFTADARYDEGHWLELDWVAGEPRGIFMRFDLEPGPDGGTVLGTTVRYDLFSLGWLVKTFLKHHPEIQFGVFPGTALVLLEAMRRAAMP
jgi:hypothetical protein